MRSFCAGETDRNQACQPLPACPGLPRTRGGSRRSRLSDYEHGSSDTVLFCAIACLTVYKLGLLHYSQFNATCIPDVINVAGGDDGRPSISEIKNYSCFVTKSVSSPPRTADIEQRLTATRRVWSKDSET